MSLLGESKEGNPQERKMPRKNTPKPAKRAKLSGIERFFKDPHQYLAEQTSILASHVPSDSGNSIPSTPLTPTVNQRESNMIHAVSNPSTSLAEFVENDEVQSQEICGYFSTLHGQRARIFL